MKVRCAASAVSVVALVCVPMACVLPPTDIGDDGSSESIGYRVSLTTRRGGVVNLYLLDTDNNGRRELPLPEGVDATRGFDLDIVNEVTYSVVDGLLGPDAPAPFIRGPLFEYSLHYHFDIAYDNGQSLRIGILEDVAPFERLLEAACPENITGSVSIDAGFLSLDIFPVFRERVINEQFDLLADVGSATTEDICNSVVRIRLFVDDAGLPDVSVTVESE